MLFFTKCELLSFFQVSPHVMLNHMLFMLRRDFGDKSLIICSVVNNCYHWWCRSLVRDWVDSPFGADTRYFGAVASPVVVKSCAWLQWFAIWSRYQWLNNLPLGADLRWFGAFVSPLVSWFAIWCRCAMIWCICITICGVGLVWCSAKHIWVKSLLGPLLWEEDASLWN